MSEWFPLFFIPFSSYNSNFFFFGCCFIPSSLSHSQLSLSSSIPHLSLFYFPNFSSFLIIKKSTRWGEVGLPLFGQERLNFAGQKNGIMDWILWRELDGHCELFELTFEFIHQQKWKWDWPILGWPLEDKIKWLN